MAKTCSIAPMSMPHPSVRGQTNFGFSNTQLRDVGVIVCSFSQSRWQFGGRRSSEVERSLERLIFAVVEPHQGTGHSGRIVRLTNAAQPQAASASTESTQAVSAARRLQRPIRRRSLTPAQASGYCTRT
jgi:hypothetical protein